MPGMAWSSLEYPGIAWKQLEMAGNAGNWTSLGVAGLG